MARATGREAATAKSHKRSSDADESFPKKPRIEGKTDHTRWRIKDDDSVHSWHYLADDEAAKAWPQSCAEKYFLNLPLVRLHNASSFKSSFCANSAAPGPARPTSIQQALRRRY